MVDGIGVAVFLRRNGRLLFGKRKGSMGNGTWQMPGGNMEPGETPEQTAQREVMEETGLEIENVQPGTFSMKEHPEVGKTYLTLFMIADAKEGKPQNCEPHKCDGWEWFEWGSLPEPLFHSTPEILASGFNPFALDLCSEVGG